MTGKDEKTSKQTLKEVSQELREDEVNSKAERF